MLTLKTFYKEYIFLLVFILLFSTTFNTLTFNELLYGISLCERDTISISAAYNTKTEKIIIAIDPGHGGEDTGAIKIINETEVINKTSTYLYNLLNANESFAAVFTKDLNEDKTISQRSEYINEIGANLVISIHANSDSSKSTHGFECFPTPPGRVFYEDSLKLAYLISNSMKENGHTLRGENGIKFAYYSGNDKTIVDSSNDKVRSSKSFGIVDKVNCPSVLIEQCFISNYSDVENWASDEGSKKSAEIYYKAICDFYNVEY